MHFLLGIDGGGTGCRAAIATPDGRILARASSGAANIRTDLTGARKNIVDAVEQAFKAAGVEPGLIARTPAVLGLAGSNVGTYSRQLEAILPFADSRVESDALIALEGAIGPGDGAIAILGTGTAYLARRGEKLRPVGGWGFLIGDQGSGARIGRDLLEETLLAHDGVRLHSPLTYAMLDVFRGDPAELVEFTTNARPGDFGGFAPLVFDHAARGDAVAEAVIGRAVTSIEASLSVLGLEASDPLCLLGGMAQAMEPRLSERFRARVRPPRQDALGGAVALAARLFGEAERRHD